MIRRFFVLAALVALVVAPASIASAKPFKASLTGNANPVFTEGSPVVPNTETGVGNATHLGIFLWADAEVAIFDSPTHAHVTGTFTMTAANGDTLEGTLETDGNIINGQLVISGTFTFTGGTGRFVGATGGGTLEAVGELAPPFGIVGSFDGTLNY